MHAQMSIMRDIIYGASAHGANFRKICEELELDPHQLNDSDKLVPFKPAAEIWNVVIQHTDDQIIGLHLGEEISPTSLGMIGYLMQSSQTLHQAVIMLCKYNELYSTMMKCTSDESGDHIFIQFEPALLWQHTYPESARQSIEIFMSGLLKVFKSLSGKKIFPLKVELMYPSRLVDEYERIFQATIQFNANRNAIIFRKSDLLLAVISYDRSLFSFFNETIEEKVKSLNWNQLFSDKIRRMVIGDFKGRVPSIEIAASHLNMTTRSLQRKLKEEKTSYRNIGISLKKELAQTILSRPEFRIGEIADILGYSGSSAFRQAFKKWKT